jgi:hypothetical protein
VSRRVDALRTSVRNGAEYRRARSLGGSRIVVSASGFDYTATQTDPVGLVDSVSTQLSRTAATDAVGLSDSKALALGHVTTDAVGLVDTASRVSANVRSATDGLGITDTASQVVAATRASTEALGLTDIEFEQLNRPLAPSDLEVLSDQATAAASYVRSFTDALGVTDAPHVTRAFTVTDDIGLVDGFAAIQAGNVVFTEALGLRDAGPGVIYNDPGVIYDDPFVTYDGTRLLHRDLDKGALTNPAGLTDAMSAVRQLTGQQSDVLGLSDAMTAVFAGLTDIADDVGITDDISVTTTGTIAVEITDNVGLVDVAGALILVDEVGLEDSLSYELTSTFPFLEDDLGLTDSLELVAATVVQIDDEIRLRDDAKYPGRGGHDGVVSGHGSFYPAGNRRRVRVAHPSRGGRIIN